MKTPISAQSLVKTLCEKCPESPINRAFRLACARKKEYSYFYRVKKRRVLYSSLLLSCAVLVGCAAFETGGSADVGGSDSSALVQVANIVEVGETWKRKKMGLENHECLFNHDSYKSSRFSLTPKNRNYFVSGGIL